LSRLDRLAVGRLAGDAGTYEWAQKLTTFSFYYNYVSGSPQTTCTGINVPGLDTKFPYTTGLSANDSPEVPLEYAYNQEKANFGATMYFMWNPGTSSADIPVPLGNVTWQAYGDVTCSNNNCTIQLDSSRSANPFQASSSYITWGANDVFSGYASCN
jgi:hypothetical protein